MRTHEGAHPCIGALDVAPIVYLRAEDRELAVRRGARGREPARGRARRAGVPLRELARDPGPPRALPTSARAGSAALAERARAGELRARLRAAPAASDGGRDARRCRPPLVAFNLELAEPRSRAAQGDRGRDARGRRRAARRARDRRACSSERGVGQVSTNVQDPFAVPLRRSCARRARRPPTRGAHVRRGRAGRARARGGARRLSRRTSS